MWADGEWPGVPRVAEGVKDRMNRLKALGNALVPQIAQLLGFLIIEYEETREWVERSQLSRT